jgi:hypothetical protein
VVLTNGLTGEVTTVVNVDSEYHTNDPEIHAPLNTDAAPSQILAGLAKVLVGAAGIGVTVTSTFADALLQVPSTHDT